MTTEIPQPPGWPIIGNLLDSDTSRHHKTYGPIFKLQFGANGPARVVVCSVELLNEICNEELFVKSPKAGGLKQVRNLTHDGLFTALHGEENWGIAHRVLMPVLGNIAIKNMFSEMHDIACQLILKWARLGPGATASANDDFTRLTLDTLALCAMDTRFNSFYSETPHRFIDAMYSFLVESGLRSARPAFMNDYVYTKSLRKYWEDVGVMREIAAEVMETRRANPTSKKDLLDAMMNGVDPKTGKGLPEETVIDNMITFLIAGHETTSGLLSFVFYELSRHPEAAKAARAEVDSVLGQVALDPSMLSQLPYITAIIRETLRLHPTAPAFSVTPKSENPANYPIFIGKERYPIYQDQLILAALLEIHRDPAIYGDDANDFKPERMLDEPFSKLPKGAWKPFGNGARACIGRALAMQEAIMVIALILQNFEFELADPNYELVILKQLTIKPKNLQLRLKLRKDVDPNILMKRLLGGSSNDVASLQPTKSDLPKSQQPGLGTERSADVLKEMIICYGSNTGTCQSLAHTLAAEAPSHGFSPLIMAMDEAVEKINSTAVPLVVITASYEGEPPDNAGSFINWLKVMNKSKSPLGGRLHAVYGCGHRDWVDTFQKIPALTDDLLKECGSKAVTARGVSDGASDNVFNEFDSWADRLLWPALEQEFCMQGKTAGDTVGVGGMGPSSVEKRRLAGLEIVRSRRVEEMQQSGCEATVLEAESLTSPGAPEKRHLKLRLSRDAKYSAGDYLSVLPVNHDETVKAVMNRFGLPIDSRVLIGDSLDSVLNVGSREASVYTLLRELVELNHPATDKNIRAIASSIPEEAQRIALETLMSSKGTGEQRPTALQLLQLFPTATLSLAEYLAMLPPLHARHYSISSSPLQEAGACTLTYGVLKGSRGGPSQPGWAQLPGAASSYLAELKANDRLWVSIRPSHQSFHLPADVTTCPMVLICAGSGLAPFRGFIQERAAIMKARPGIQLAKCMLFIGCRDPESDVLYGKEMRGWEKNGVLELKYAFSKASSKSEGCKYVQDRLWKHRAAIMALVMDRKGKIYVCGTSSVVDGVSKCLVRAYAERAKTAPEEASKWLRSVRNDQFICDVFN